MVSKRVNLNFIILSNIKKTYLNMIKFKTNFSIPIIAQFEKILKSKTILMGFGLDSDAIHSPNEHFGVSNFLNGIETITKFYHHYTK